MRNNFSIVSSVEEKIKTQVIFLKSDYCSLHYLENSKIRNFIKKKSTRDYINRVHRLSSQTTLILYLIQSLFFANGRGRGYIGIGSLLFLKHDIPMNHQNILSRTF